MQLDDSDIFSASATWPRYSLYGITVATDFQFANKLPPAIMPADLAFARVLKAPTACNPAGLALAYANSSSREVNPGIYAFVIDDARAEESLIIRFVASADYYIYSDRIICHLLDQSLDYLAEIQFLGLVLAVWLEWKGVLAIHASAVVTEHGAIGFLASNKGGKSSLAASLMFAGCPLLTDDILTLEAKTSVVLARPGFPSMRMWPDQAEHFFGGNDAFETVHPSFSKRRIPIGCGGLETFHTSAAKMERFCIPEMHDSDDPRVVMEPLTSRNTLLQLIEHSFATEIISALGWQSRRLPLLAKVTSQVPAFVLRYPRGIVRLPDVARQIRDACTCRTDGK